MNRAKLLGSHSHSTITKVNVHVWLRDNRYLARGSYRGRRFGVTMSACPIEAASQLQQLLVEIENGSFLRPSEARYRPLSCGVVPTLSLRELMNEYLIERRQLRGQKTADTYRSRLMPVLDFVERPSMLQRWPLAKSVDREFAVKLRVFLFGEYRTSRNGRAGGVLKAPSERHLYNILECLRGMFAWARRPEIRKLPSDWVNPLTQEIMGHQPRKDPFRTIKMPLDKRVVLLRHMDHYQFCVLSLLTVLPLRPEEAAGILVSDINWEKTWIEFRTRFAGSDFTKGRTEFVVPFPAELHPIIRECIGGRAEGPLLLRRAVLEKRSKSTVESKEELARLMNLRLAKNCQLQTEQDRKREFRRLLRELGGVSPDVLSKEFTRLRKTCGLGEDISLYALRHAISTEMANTPGISHLALRYLTGHQTNDIMREYVSVDPTAAMQLYFERCRPLLDVIIQRIRATTGVAA